MNSTVLTVLHNFYRHNWKDNFWDSVKEKKWNVGLSIALSIKHASSSIQITSCKKLACMTIETSFEFHNVTNIMQ